MRVAYSIAAVTIIVMASTVPWSHAAKKSQQATAEHKPTLYNYAGKGSDSHGETEAKAHYRSWYNVVDFNDERGYFPAKVSKKTIPPRLKEGGRIIRGFVRIGVIVNENGRLVEPMVEYSTNPKLNRTLLSIIQQWSGSPAFLHGKPVATLKYQDFDFR